MTPLGRFKRPDKKNAESLLEASKREIDFALKLEINKQSASTIVRNIYEAFRMLGDSLVTARGFESYDHLLPINQLLKLKVETKRPIRTIENLRQLRHNINYYGYQPGVAEVVDVIEIAKTCFLPLWRVVKAEIEKS